MSGLVRQYTERVGKRPTIADWLVFSPSEKRRVTFYMWPTDSGLIDCHVSTALFPNFDVSVEANAKGANHQEAFEQALAKLLAHVR